MEVIDKIKNIIELLDELDDYFEELPNSQSQLDNLISDYRHFVRENDLEKISISKVVEELQQTELKRKQVKKDLDILNIYNKLKNRLLSKTNREFLLNELYKREKEWHSPYKYRVLTDEEIENLFCEKKKRGRPRKEEISNENKEIS